MNSEKFTELTPNLHITGVKQILQYQLPILREGYDYLPLPKITTLKVLSAIAASKIKE